MAPNRVPYPLIPLAQPRTAGSSPTAACVLLGGVNHAYIAFCCDLFGHFDLLAVTAISAVTLALPESQGVTRAPVPVPPELDFA